MKPPTRPRDECEKCGEVQEIAAHGLCFRCYRAQGRVRDRAQRQVDRHSGAIRKEHKKLFSAHGKLMAALCDIGLSRDDVMSVKATIQPYLVAIQEYLDHVNCEHSDVQFTIHSKPEEPEPPAPPDPQPRNNGGDKNDART